MFAQAINRQATCMAAGCGRHGMPPPACKKNPTPQGFIAAAVAVDRSCSIGVAFLMFLSLPFGRPYRYDTLNFLSQQQSSLTFHLLTLKLVRIIVRSIRNLLANFDVVYGTFRSRLMDLSDAPICDIATLTFDLAGDGPSRRYRSSSSHQV